MGNFASSFDLVQKTAGAPEGFLGNVKGQLKGFGAMNYMGDAIQGYQGVKELSDAEKVPTHDEVGNPIPHEARVKAIKANKQQGYGDIGEAAGRAVSTLGTGALIGLTGGGAIPMIAGGTAANILGGKWGRRFGEEFGKHGF